MRQPDKAKATLKKAISKAGAVSPAQQMKLDGLARRAAGVRRYAGFAPAAVLRHGRSA